MQEEEEGVEDLSDKVAEVVVFDVTEDRTLLLLEEEEW